jgi:hypothetical protein
MRLTGTPCSTAAAIGFTLTVFLAAPPRLHGQAAPQESAIRNLDQKASSSITSSRGSQSASGVATRAGTFRYSALRVTAGSTRAARSAGK